MSFLDEALALQPQPDGSFSGRTHPQWANMVGPFGGITAAQALQAVRLHPQVLGEPLSITVNFCAAMAEGGFSAVARPLRTNRSTQHWFVELQQGGQTVTSATAVTAIRRHGWSVDEWQRPEVPPPDAVPVFEPPPGAVAWLDRYEMRPVHGGLPDSLGREHGDSRTTMWVRPREAQPLHAPALAALADTFYPRAWRRSGRFAPAGTVSMTVYFHAGAERLAHSVWLLAEATGQAFRDGFFDQRAALWNEAGELVVTTHQVVYFKP